MEDRKTQELKNLRMEVHLLREELSGLREMLEGVTSALSGAQKAYAAVAQRADLLDKRIESSGYRKLAKSAVAAMEEDE